MKRIVISSYLVFAVFSFLVFFGINNYSLTFGLGIGDLVFILVLIAINLFLIIFIKKIVTAKGKTIGLLTVLCLLAVMLYYCICLTIWRGAEQPWNGKIIQLSMLK